MTRGFFDNPGPGGECPEGFESREYPPGSGVYFCTNKLTNCILSYELIDPKDPSKGCKYIFAGQDCTLPDSPEPYCYDDKGQCVPKRLYQPIATTTTTAAAPAAESSGMMLAKGAAAVAALYVGWMLLAGGSKGGGGMRRTARRRR